MTFTSLLAQQQSRINAAREHYRECNDKLNHLIDQIMAADAWDTDAVTKLNKEIEIAGNQTQAAMQAWDKEIAAIANIPETDDEPASTATMAEWEEAAALVPLGYRVKDGWFHDAFGGRCNIPSAKLTQRQVEILIGVIPVS